MKKWINVLIAFFCIILNFSFLFFIFYCIINIEKLYERLYYVRDLNYNKTLNVSDLFELSSVVLSEYFFIFCFLIVSVIISLVIISFSLLTALQQPDKEKISPYECGFEPYENARNTVSVKFYIIGMLFIIFDLETMYFIPWCISLSYTNQIGYWLMLDFILELILMFFYAWYVGALDWK